MPLRTMIDSTLGKWLRHLTFVIVRPYFSLFYNVSCSGKHLLQDLPGGLILATHISRLDGPLIAAMLYSTRRVRPAVHYNEYFNLLQWLPMALAGAVPLSSPKHWAPERRAARKVTALENLRRIISDGGLFCCFQVAWPNVSRARSSSRIFPAPMTRSGRCPTRL